MIAAPPVALTVSPTRLVVATGERRDVEIVNRGRGPAAVTVTTAAYVVGLRGRPGIGGRSRLLVVRPHTLTIPAGATATLAVRPAAVPATPGDRAALVLVTSRSARAGVAAALRIGVVVVVRGPGRLVRRVVPLAAHRRGRVLELRVRNDGNVSERLSGALLHVRLLPLGRAIVEPRELLPHTKGIVRVRLRAAGRAPTAAVVRILGRRYRLRLR